MDVDSPVHSTALVPHIGVVEIEDDVEIAASCVDRAKFGKTLIGAGTKVDSLVQIAQAAETLRQWAGVRKLPVLIGGRSRSRAAGKT